MNQRLESAPATDEDSDIWLSIVTLYMEDWATVGVIFRDSDRCDADLMFELADMKAYMPDGKAVAHRMVDGSTNRQDSMYINGYWVVLA